MNLNEYQAKLIELWRSTPDGVHIRRDSHQLKLPAYAVWNDEFFELDPIVH